MPKHQCKHHAVDKRRRGHACANEEVHWHKRELEADVEENQIAGDEHPDHRRLDREQPAVVFLEPLVDCGERPGHAQRHEQRRQQDQQHRDRISPQAQRDAELLQARPGDRRLEPEAAVGPVPKHQCKHHAVDKRRRGHPKRNPLRLPRRRHRDDDRPEQRNRKQQRRPDPHQPAPPIQRLSQSTS